MKSKALQAATEFPTPRPWYWVHRHRLVEGAEYLGIKWQALAFALIVFIVPFAMLIAGIRIGFITNGPVGAIVGFIVALLVGVPYECYVIGWVNEWD